MVKYNSTTVSPSACVIPRLSIGSPISPYFSFANSKISGVTSMKSISSLKPDFSCTFYHFEVFALSVKSDLMLVTVMSELSISPGFDIWLLRFSVSPFVIKLMYAHSYQTLIQLMLSKYQTLPSFTILGISENILTT